MSTNTTIKIDKFLKGLAKKPDWETKKISSLRIFLEEKGFRSKITWNELHKLIKEFENSE